MVSPHYPQTTKSCPAKDRDIPEFSGSRINLLVSKDMCLFNRSTQIWTVSELTKHASHCLCFAGSAKPLTLNWNATRTIYSNWCFLESTLNTLNKSNESSACGLGLPQRNFKHWHYSQNVIWIWSTVWQKNSQCNKVKIKKNIIVIKTFYKSRNHSFFYAYCFE